MREFGVDMRNSDIDMNVLRDVISKRELFQFQTQKFSKNNSNYS